MASMYVKFVFCVSILAYTCEPSLGNNGDRTYTTDSIDQRVKDEIVRVEKLLDEIKDPKYDKLKGKIIGLWEGTLKRAVMVDDLIFKHGSLAKDLTGCEQIVRDVVCGKRFRYVMEIFGIDSGVQKGHIQRCSDNLKEALKKIKKRVDDKRLLIQFCVYNLRKLYLEYLPDTDGFKLGPGFEIWSNKVKSEYRELRKEQINQRITTLGNQLENSKCPKLADLVREFYYAKDDAYAVEIFTRQCSQYCWSNKNIEMLEKDQINELVVPWSDDENKKFIPEIRIGNRVGKDGGVHSEEHEFIKQALVTGKYFINYDKHYRHCVEVFYFGKAAFVEHLYNKMTSKWKEDNVPALVDRFCSNFHSLYNLISVTDIHSPPQMNTQCTPNSTDYQRYVKKIASTPELIDDYTFIAEALGLVTDISTATISPVSTSSNE